MAGGVGPFLAVFLTSAQHWDAGGAGAVLTIGGLATVLARTPAGALTDTLRAKRALIALAAVAVALAAVVMAVWPRFWPVALAQAANGVADAVFPAAVAAISLGIVGRARFTARVGRNEAFNHGGNVLTAIAAGLAGSFLLPAGALWIAARARARRLAPLAAVLAGDIDQATARGADDGDRGSGERDGLARAAAQSRAARLHRGDHAVSFRQRRHAAAGRRGAGAGTIRRSPRCAWPPASSPPRR